MRDILEDVERWHTAGKQVAVATVAKDYASALRPLGAKMACTSTGEVTGSISGGCVEAAVYEAAQDTLRTQRPTLLEFGIADETAWSVGLACGGTIQVWVETVDPDLLRTLADHLRSGEELAVATIVAGSDLGRRLLVWPDRPPVGAIGSPELTGQVTAYARQRLAAQAAGRACFPVPQSRIDFPVPHSRVDVLVEVFPPRPRLIVVGAVHIAIPLVTIAKTLRFHTVVVDARSTFATPERFPHADELIVQWPSRALERLRLDTNTSTVIVTHDDKVDLPALQACLATPAPYVGILGSRAHHAQRCATLAQRGVTSEALARVHAPVGLDLGAIGPEEIALAIMAEIVAVRRRAPGTALRSLADSRRPPR